VKSALFEAMRTIRIVERPRPEVSGGEVLLRVRYCGICGTDVRIYTKGTPSRLGTVLGHELCGEIVACGPEARGHRPGTRVAVNPMPACGACYHCRRGEYSLCAEAGRREIGFSPEYDGGMAEYVLIRQPDQMLIPLPDTVTFEQAALVEPLAVSLHAVKLSGQRIGETALVLGTGMIGLGVVAFLRHAGAGLIVAADRSPAKLELARRMGADVVLEVAEGADLAAQVRGLTGGRGPDRVFECAGTPAAFRLAPQLVKRGGQVVLAGFCDEEVLINPHTLVMGAVELKAVIGYYDDFGDVVRFLARQPFDVQDLISGVIPLEDVEARGFRKVLEDPGTIRVLVRPGSWPAADASN
jgi:(R,R)-butanediol dehydrogenase/meso-butanediol dehydrogenase/diacetyl reductase